MFYAKRRDLESRRRSQRYINVSRKNVNDSIPKCNWNERGKNILKQTCVRVFCRRRGCRKTRNERTRNIARDGRRIGRIWRSRNARERRWENRQFPSEFVDARVRHNVRVSSIERFVDDRRCRFCFFCFFFLRTVQGQGKHGEKNVERRPNERVVQAQNGLLRMHVSVAELDGLNYLSGGYRRVSGG